MFGCFQLEAGLQSVIEKQQLTKTNGKVVRGMGAGGSSL